MTKPQESAHTRILGHLALGGGGGLSVKRVVLVVIAFFIIFIVFVHLPLFLFVGDLRRR
jgi:hypothetical protein